MKRTLATAIACGMLAIAPSASGQTSSADGVGAYMRGDYNSAADILKPLSERTFQRDQVSEFLMASMYETGRGVPVDLVRACALYLRAADGGPFDLQAQALWRATHKRLTGQDAEECSALAKIGFNHGFRPVTFTLGPEHWVAWSLNGATVTYKDKETRAPVVSGMRGSRFLPVRYTELAVGPTRSTRRHFMELFVWIPDERGTWRLSWSLYEAVREKLVAITNRTDLSTVVGADPPADSTTDVRSLVSLRTTDVGDAELTLAGKTPYSMLIETEAENQEAAETKAARAAALKNVGYKTTRDVNRPPSFAYPVADGCSAMNQSMSVFAFSADRMEAILLYGNPETLQLSPTPRTFDALAYPYGPEVRVYVYDRAEPSQVFCTDVRTNPPAEQEWRAVAGRVTIASVPVAARVHTPATQRVTIRIDGAVFANSAGVRVNAPGPIVLTATLVPGGFGG